ncbi:MAG: hypothetical protein R2857_02335 [Vampirovibrionales bacterium]
MKCAAASTSIPDCRIPPNGCPENRRPGRHRQRGRLDAQMHRAAPNVQHDLKLLADEYFT